MEKSIFNKYTLYWLLFALALFGITEGLIAAKILRVYYQSILLLIGINIILAVGLNIIIGITGQFSLGHAGFMSIGAYSTAIALRYVDGYPGFALGLLIAVILTFIVSLLVAIPTLRLKGDYLAIATLGVAEIIRIIILNLEITNRAAGINNIDRLISVPTMFLYASIAVIFAVNFKRSAVGRACIGIKEDEIAAEAMGINTTRYKVTAFIFGAILAAFGGALYATTYAVVRPEFFGLAKSIDILVIVVFGGMGSLTGTIVAAFALGIINVLLQPLGDARMILYALALIAVMIFRPQGLMGTFEASIKDKDFKSFTKFLPKRKESVK